MAPSFAALLTLFSLCAPTSPLCDATRVQNSGRAVTREAAEWEEVARIVDDMLGWEGSIVTREENVVRAREGGLLLLCDERGQKIFSFFYFTKYGGICLV